MGWNEQQRGYNSSGPANSHSAQQGQIEREQARARAEAQRRSEEMLRQANAAQLSRQAAALSRHAEPQGRGDPGKGGRSTSGGIRAGLFSFGGSTAPAGKSRAGTVIAVVLVWWLVGTLISMALQKLGVDRELALKIGIATPPALLGIAVAAGICVLVWQALKAGAEWYVAHRRATHVVLVFALLSVVSQAGLGAAAQLAGVSAAGRGWSILGMTIGLAALGTWLMTRKLPRLFK
jgi:hypothetical protein